MDRTRALLVAWVVLAAGTVGAASPAPGPAPDPGAVADHPNRAVPTSAPLPDVVLLEAGGDPDPGTEDGDSATATRAIVNGTPERLALGAGTVESGYGTPRADLGATLEMSDGELRSRYDAYRARRDVEAADTDYTKREAIHTALDGIERRIESIRAREQQAVRAYHAGDLTRRELLRTLARLDAETGSLRDAITDLQRVGASVIDRPLDRRLENLDGELQSLQSPVRDRIASGLRGGGSVGTVHVAATDTGVVLETVDDGRYDRDAVRFDNYDPGDEDRYEESLDAVLNRIGELYPWASTEQSGISIDWTASRLYVTDISHPQGTTLVYLDGGTGNVYREVQRLRLSRLPTESVETVVENGVVVRVNDTLGNNPLQISVVDASTGDPIDAAVTIDDQQLGRTGSDGRTWALGPRGTATLEVDTGRETISITLGE